MLLNPLYSRLYDLLLLLLVQELNVSPERSDLGCPWIDKETDTRGSAAQWECRVMQAAHVMGEYHTGTVMMMESVKIISGIFPVCTMVSMPSFSRFTLLTGLILRYQSSRGIVKSMRTSPNGNSNSWRAM